MAWSIATVVQLKCQKPVAGRKGRKWLVNVFWYHYYSVVPRYEQVLY